MDNKVFKVNLKEFGNEKAELIGEKRELLIKELKKIGVKFKKHQNLNNCDDYTFLSFNVGDYELKIFANIVEYHNDKCLCYFDIEDFVSLKKTKFNIIFYLRTEKYGNLVDSRYKIMIKTRKSNE